VHPLASRMTVPAPQPRPRARRPAPLPTPVLAGAHRPRPARACPMKRDHAATRRGAAEQTRLARCPARPC
jgi:hypothetical protein